jgi:hypothetical protein
VTGTTVQRGTPVLLGLFFAFATLMCAFAAATLLDPGGPLDALWRIKPDEHRALLATGPLAGVGFGALAVIMALTSWGCFGRRRWGLQAAMVILAVNAAGDLIRAVSGRWAEGLFGAAIAGALLWWLSRRGVRRMFER